MSWILVCQVKIIEKEIKSLKHVQENAKAGDGVYCIHITQQNITLSSFIISLPNLPHEWPPLMAAAPKFLLSHTLKPPKHPLPLFLTCISSPISISLFFLM